MLDTHPIRLVHLRLATGARTLVMGIVNVTPDSFYSGTRHLADQDAVACGRRLIAEGADILDVGGESTRPGARPVDADEEAARVVPVIRALAESTAVPISVDTYKAQVARLALEAGAQVVNDISGLAFDPDLAGVIASSGAAVVLSHIRGTPATMNRMPPSADIVAEVRSDLLRAVDRALQAGIARDRILIDPGIGFGKTAPESLRLIDQLAVLTETGFPVLVGPSRKSFIGRVLRQDRPEDRLLGTAAAVACCVLRGAAVVRVHDVAAMRQVVDVAAAIRNAVTE